MLTKLSCFSVVVSDNTKASQILKVATCCITEPAKIWPSYLQTQSQILQIQIRKYELDNLYLNL